MKVLICPDSFKESLGAYEAAQAVKAAFEAVAKQRTIELAAEAIPIADGGEGSAFVLSRVLSGELCTAEVTGPYGERVSAKYLMHANTAYIEMAEASGLALTERREVKRATTYGTGELILDAVRRCASKIVVFIGGSATCDGGMGMAEALGYSFYNKQGEKLDGVGESLSKIARIEKPCDDMLSGIELWCASDVTNPLFGELGAAYVFARQKGATDKDIEELDLGLRNFSYVVGRDMSCDISMLPGAGAAGGLGAGLFAFCSAHMCGGFELISDVIGLEERISRCELVITGEGCTDAQSMMGKVVGKIANICRAHKKRLAVISGTVKDKDKLSGLDGVFYYECVKYAPCTEESIKNPLPYLTLAARTAADELL